MRTTLVAVGVALLVVALIAFEFVASAGRIHQGVSVGGVPVGGKRPAEAVGFLGSELALRAANPVILSAAGETASVTATQVALSFETTALANAAYAVGRSGSVLTDVRERVRAWVLGVKLSAQPTANKERIDAVISAFAEKVDVSAKNAAVVIDGESVEVSPSSDGSALDREAARVLLAKAFTQEDRTVRIPVVTSAPEVSDAAAGAAAEDARQMLSDDVEIAFDSERWSFSPKEIAKWIGFRRSAEPTAPANSAAEDSTSAQAADGSGDVALSGEGVLQAYVDPAKARALIMPELGVVGRPAKDATFKVSAGNVSIVPSQDGVGPDMDALSRELTRALKDSEATRSVALRTRRVSPQITTAKAQTMGIKERISRYTTTYAASNRPRVGNIHLLADAIDGTLIEPGGTFSFNGAVGPRTAEKGYQEANAIVNGKLVPQLGGGICQVGTTLFNTVYESGLPVVERHNHSFYISHYPKGRDATVSWGGPDFKFKNDTGKWILLATGYSNSSLTIALYGTDPGYSVTSQAGPWQNEKPFPSEETKDPTLPLGARVVEDGGVTGRTCTVKRIVKKDGQIVRTDDFRSVYRPKVEIVRVGTKPLPSKGTTTGVSPSR